LIQLFAHSSQNRAWIGHRNHTVSERGVALKAAGGAGLVVIGLLGGRRQRYKKLIV
jgi:hypothetical protein